jgi:hypothetical protein
MNSQKQRRCTHCRRWVATWVITFEQVFCLFCDGLLWRLARMEVRARSGKP